MSRSLIHLGVMVLVLAVMVCFMISLMGLSFMVLAVSYSRPNTPMETVQGSHHRAADSFRDNSRLAESRQAPNDEAVFNAMLDRREDGFLRPEPIEYDDGLVLAFR